jgi:hypothetical protein
VNERLLTWLRCPGCGADDLDVVPVGTHADASPSGTEYPLVRLLAWGFAVLDTAVPITGYRSLHRLGVSPALLDRLVPEHVRLYAGQSFRTCYTDWLDRLSYPYVHYYSGEDLARWFAGAGLTPQAIRPLGQYGWVGLAQVVPTSSTVVLERTV